MDEKEIEYLRTHPEELKRRLEEGIKQEKEYYEKLRKMPSEWQKARIEERRKKKL